MELKTETERVVAQFEYTDKDVNKGVKEFLRQMGEYPVVAPNCERMLIPVAGEGLEKYETSLSQIPTYVTAVPTGAEKVSLEPYGMPIGAHFTT
jgi:hexokinase